MNVLYSKKNTRKINIDTPPPPVSANASGDGDGAPPRCCRLCGGDAGLHYFGDTYLCEGVEVRYDRLLYDCFGVQVTPADCMICERCVRSLRSTEKFRALVYAAFEGAQSEASSSSSTLIKTNSVVKNIVIIPTAHDQAKQKPLEPSKKKENKKKYQYSDNKLKRINIPCEICKQRYPMLISNDSQKTFVCSRCKKHGETKSAVCRKCNVMMPVNVMKDHLELHHKADLRAKTRLNQPRKLPLSSNSVTEKQQKFQCSLCPKKYTFSKNLLAHLKDTHGDETDTAGYSSLKRTEKDKIVSSQDTNVHQCDKCHIIFKNEKSLTNHSIEHIMQKPNRL